MAKTIGLKQLAQKKYVLLQDLPQEWKQSIGELDDTFDAILYGPSGSGKTNCTVLLLKALLRALKNSKAEYVSWEEGHGKTVQDLMIHRHKMLDDFAGRVKVTEHISLPELDKRIGGRQTAKIWIFDSIQASGITWDQYRQLKEKYIGKKKKIFICIAWGDGLKPDGAIAKKIEFYCNIKMRVEGKVMFPKSRYGGNKPFVIWKGEQDEEGALKYWGKEYFKISGEERPKKTKREKPQSLPCENLPKNTEMLITVHG
jgi:hypothetical protein